MVDHLNLPITDTGDAHSPEAGALLAVSWLLFIIAFVFLSLRIWSRRLIERRFTVDDWLLVASDVLTFALAVTITVASHKPHWVAPVAPGMKKAVLAFDFIYWFAIATLKISVLALFHRYLSALSYRILETYRWTRACILLFLVLVLAQSVMSAMILMFACQPISLLWDGASDSPGCIDLVRVQGINASVNALTSAVMVVVPIIFIARHGIRFRYNGLYKVACVLAILSTLASATRVLTFFVFNATVQADRIIIFLPMFSMIELTFGITAVSLMCIDALLRRNELNESPIATPSKLRIQGQLALRRSSRGTAGSRSSFARFMSATKRNLAATPNDIEAGSIHVAKVVEMQAKIVAPYAVPIGVRYDKYGQRVGQATKGSNGNSRADKKSTKSSWPLGSSTTLPTETATDSPLMTPTSIYSTTPRVPLSTERAVSKLLPPLEFPPVSHNPSTIGAAITKPAEVAMPLALSNVPRREVGIVGSPDRGTEPWLQVQRSLSKATSLESLSVRETRAMNSASQRVLRPTASTESILRHNRAFAQEVDRAFGQGEKQPKVVRPKSLNTMAKEYMLRAAYGHRDSWRREDTK